VSELIEQLKLLNTPCRKTDALIAIALHEKRGPHWKDDRDSSHARLPILEEQPKAGQYEISGFSGVELKSAPEYTLTEEGRKSAITALEFHAVRNSGECPSCGLKAETMLHRFCQHKKCPVRDALEPKP